jgi:hypothetical protein
MSTRAWFATTIGVTLFLVVAVAGINAFVDIYGIFRNPAGRHLAVYGDERIAKYLLCEKYVPANFDAIVVGSSVSANWDMSGVDSIKTYNASLNGGNIVEEKTVFDQTLAAHRLKAVFLVVHPFLTSSHEFETVRLTPRENVAALGSLSLLDAYKDKLHTLLHEDGATDAFGTTELGDNPQPMNAIVRKLLGSPGEFPIDPISFDANRALIAEVHSRGVPIVFIIPPLSENLLESRSGQFAGYSRLILGDKALGDKVIDFTSPDYLEFRKNSANFKDGVHLTDRAAREVVADIRERLDDWTGNGQLPAPRPTIGSQQLVGSANPAFGRYGLRMQ